MRDYDDGLDVLLPTQTGSKPNSPERNLWRAVLVEAAAALQLRDVETTADVRAFVESRWFDVVCDFADLDPDAARAIFRRAFVRWPATRSDGKAYANPQLVRRYRAQP